MSFLSCSLRYGRAFSTRPLPDSAASCRSISPSFAAAFAASARLRTSVAASTDSTSSSSCVTRMPVGLAILAITCATFWGCSSGIVPQAVLRDLQVLGPHLVGPVQVGERLHHADAS